MSGASNARRRGIAAAAALAAAILTAPGPALAGEFFVGGEGRTDRGYRTDHFTVFYASGLYAQLLKEGHDSNTPRYVSQIGDELESIRARLVQWGFKVPEKQTVWLFPVTYGRDAVWGSFMRDLRPEVAGEATIVGHLFVGCFQPSGSLIPLDSLRLTLAHEYFHRVQMQYYNLVPPDPFVREGTAAVIELLSYPAVAEAAVRASENVRDVRFGDLTLTLQGEEAMAFYLYLCDRFGGAGFLTAIWEEYGASWTDTSGRASIESAAKRRGVNDDLPYLFFDFAEEFYTTLPPRNPLYRLLRQRKAGGSVIAERALGDAERQAVPFDDMPALTARYVIVRVPAKGKVVVRLDRALPRTSVRVYSTSANAAESLGTLTVAVSEDDGLPVPAGTSVGILVTHNGRGTGGAHVTVIKKDEEEEAATNESGCGPGPTARAPATR